MGYIPQPSDAAQEVSLKQDSSCAFSLCFWHSDFRRGKTRSERVIRFVSTFEGFSGYFQRMSDVGFMGSKRPEKSGARTVKMQHTYVASCGKMWSWCRKMWRLCVLTRWHEKSWKNFEDGFLDDFGSCQGCTCWYDTIFASHLETLRLGLGRWIHVEKRSTATAGLGPVKNLTGRKFEFERCSC